jgi:hypothetical protein
MKDLKSLSNDALLRRLADVLGQSRRIESDVVVHIGEVDERRLFAEEASPSMFRYCTDVLHMSEAEAYLRINVAHALRESIPRCSRCSPMGGCISVELQS